MDNISDSPSPAIEAVPRQTVLVVDDSPTDLLYLTRLLESPQRHILTAKNSDEAIKIVNGVELALLILDVQLDGESGFDIAKILHEDDRVNHLPIIFVTATSRDQEQIFQGYDVGAVDYLFKPVEPSLLRSKAKVFCELSAQRVVIERQLEEIQTQYEVLNQQLDEIKTLRGLVPICARCKSVRDDTGFWQSIEAYVSEHSEAEFSHSLCPGCADTLYPGISAKAKNPDIGRRKVKHV